MKIQRTGINTVSVLGVEMNTGYVFTLPLLVFFAAMLYPVFRVLMLSVFHVSFLNPQAREFVALTNYLEILSPESRFLGALGRSLVWVAGSLVVKIAVGLALALLLNRGMRGRSVYRALSIMPWGIPWAIAAMMWGWALNTQYGIVNAVLRRLDLVAEPVAFLSNPILAFVSLIVVDAWIGIPFMVVMLEAGLKAIPGQLYESARVDGANGVQLFARITLPLLKRVLLTAALLSTVWTFNSFDPIWVLTQGGPLQTTETLPIAIYNAGFRMIAGGDLGIAAAMTVGQVLVVTVIAVFYIRALKEGTNAV